MMCSRTLGGAGAGAASMSISGRDQPLAPSGRLRAPWRPGSGMPGNDAEPGAGVLRHALPAAAHNDLLGPGRSKRGPGVRIWRQLTKGRAPSRSSGSGGCSAIGQFADIVLPAGFPCTRYGRGPASGYALWFTPASLEAVMSVNRLQVYQFSVLHNRFPHTFSVTYHRSTSGCGPRYTSGPSPLLRPSHHPPLASRRGNQ